MRTALTNLLRKIHDRNNRPIIMGIVNVTPDSFFAPSRVSAGGGIESVLELIEQGADMLDIGGESTRPGSEYVSEQEELQRVLPVISKIRQHSDVVISLDTRKSEVARLALQAGADIINDISGFRDDPQLLPLVVKQNTPIVIMHMRGQPKDMQEHPWYQDVVQEVGNFLQDRLIQAIAAGVKPEHIILDPGIGFGKRLEDNLALIRSIGTFSELSGSPDGGYPVLLGHSRKGFIRLLQETITHSEDDLGPDSQSRLFGSIAAGLYGVAQGARILRVHDPRETRQSLQVWWGIQQGRQVE